MTPDNAHKDIPGNPSTATSSSTATTTSCTSCCESEAYPSCTTREATCRTQAWS